MHIMNNMEQSNHVVAIPISKGGYQMEKLYQKINTIGISNLVMGIVTILVGVGAGVTMIVGGARLIISKKDITF